MLPVKNSLPLQLIHVKIPPPKNNMSLYYLNDFETRLLTFIAEGRKGRPCKLQSERKNLKTGSLLTDEWEFEKYWPCPTAAWIGIVITGTGIYWIAIQRKTQQVIAFQVINCLSTLVQIYFCLYASKTLKFKDFFKLFSCKTRLCVCVCYNIYAYK